MATWQNETSRRADKERNDAISFRDILLLTSHKTYLFGDVRADHAKCSENKEAWYYDGCIFPKLRINPGSSD